jgi:hypothetical protein
LLSARPDHLRAALVSCRGSSSTACELQCPAGGIGYSNLRRLQTQSCGGSAPATAAAGEAGVGPRELTEAEAQEMAVLQTVPSMQPSLAVATDGVNGSESSSRAADENSHSSRLDMQQQQQQQEQMWTSEDVVMSWYHHSDEEDEVAVPNSTAVAASHTAATGAAAAAAGLSHVDPASPRVRLQRANSNTATLAGSASLLAASSSATAAAGPGLLTTSSSGIEYAKLLRTQVGRSPAVSPRHSRFQLQQLQDVAGSCPAGAGAAKCSSNLEIRVHSDEHWHSGVAVCSELVTGWYSSGLHSDSSCNNSPEACYADPQQQPRNACAEVPHACGTVRHLVSSGGGAAAMMMQAPNTRGAGIDMSRGWSNDSACVTPYTNVLSYSGADSAAAGGLIAAPLGSGQLTQQSTLGGVCVWSDGADRGSSSSSTGGGCGIGVFDLRPCLAAPLVSAKEASVPELLAASQAQIHSMENTLVSMLQAAKRLTEGGANEPCLERSLRERFSSN